MGTNKSRMIEDYPNVIDVKKISLPALGKEITKRCGNEGRHRDLKKSDQTTLRFLQTAISFVPDAIKVGADLTNAAFIFAQPGKEFVIKAGNGDWEFYFSEDDRDEILGRCVRTGRRPFVQRFGLQKLWNCFSYILCRASFPLEAVTGTETPLAITEKEEKRKRSNRLGIVLLQV